mgnify:CR=1 FL=1|tara:strand:+ start:5938 stop:7224 length:1287 start_codon:yes stop_codon:yes gene_type:complete
MNRSEIADYCLEKLKEKGIEKANCNVSFSEKKELNVEADRMSLFRTTFNANIGISVIQNQKKGSLSINKTDKESINKAVDDVILMANSSHSDSAHDISPFQPKGEFQKGEKFADMENMYLRLEEFVEYVKDIHPTINLEAAIIDYNQSISYFKNSNGVNYKTRVGMYGFGPMFTAKDGKDTSSFNYSGMSMIKLDKPLVEKGSIKRLLKQSTEQVRTKSIPSKFKGKILVSPDCISDFLNFITSDISDGQIISGKSIYMDKLEHQITSNNFSLHSKPVSNQITDGYFLTSDGFLAEDLTIIDKGVLKSHLLSLYGANKTGRTRAINDGGAYIIDPGNKKYEELIKGIDKGILLERFSGGSPSSSGEFSGVAKNSYFIENGEVKYPISETMISGNISELFKNIIAISKNQIDFGYCILPWVAFDGVTIS